MALIFPTTNLITNISTATVAGRNWIWNGKTWTSLQSSISTVGASNFADATLHAFKVVGNDLIYTIVTDSEANLKDLSNNDLYDAAELGTSEYTYEISDTGQLVATKV